MPQNIMCALRAVIRSDHFKFASYGPGIGQQVSLLHNISSKFMK